MANKIEDKKKEKAKDAKGSSDLIELLKFLYDYALKPFRKELISLNLFIVVAAIISAAVPYIYGHLFDLILEGTVFEMVIGIIILWAILNIVSEALRRWIDAKASILSYKISVVYGANALVHLIELPMAFHKKKKIGEVFNTVERSIWRLDSSLRHSFTLLSSLLTFIFAIVIMVWIKWYLGLLALFAFVFSTFVGFKNIKDVLKKEKALRNAWNRMYGSVYDKVINPLLVKLFSQEQREKTQIRRQFATNTYKPLAAEENAWMELDIRFRFIFTIFYVLILSVSMLLIQSNELTPGNVVMFFGYLSMATAPFLQVTYIWTEAQQAIIYLRKTMNYLRMKKEKDYYGKLRLKDLKGKITFKDVHFSHTPGREILKDVNFTIMPGEKIGIVGRSGVGKTTLAELLAGFNQPTKGEILIDDIPMKKYDLEWLRRNIGFVSQEISLLNETIKTNLLYAKPNASMNEIVRYCKLAHAHDFIQNFPKKYDQRVGERGIKLSVGQKQRIMIAMAFLKNPKILILDEPTAALDPESEKYVQEGLEELMKGRTVFIIAHRLATLRKCDRIIVLHKGRIVETGNHEELMRKKGIYYKYYTLQTGLK